MNKRQLQNSELDAIGVKLLRAGKLSDKEIDRIVSAPELFDAVRKRIAIQEKRRTSHGGLSWKPAVASLAAVAALITSFGYLGYWGEQEIPPLTRSSGLPPVPKVENDTVKRGFEPVATYPRRPEVSRPTITKAVYRENLQQVQPKPRLAETESEGQFYALSFAGNVEDAVRGGHVVRVDMPRSTLFALGVDLPLENDSKFIKTDLLVGTDGVPRAIRFVD